MTKFANDPICLQAKKSYRAAKAFALAIAGDLAYQEQSTKLKSQNCGIAKTYLLST